MTLEETITDIVRLRLEGKNIVEISEALNLNAYEVDNYLIFYLQTLWDNNGGSILSLEKSIQHTYPLERIVKLANRGYNMSEIADIEDLHIELIRRCLKKHLEDYESYINSNRGRKKKNGKDTKVLIMDKRMMYNFALTNENILKNLSPTQWTPLTKLHSLLGIHESIDLRFLLIKLKKLSQRQIILEKHKTGNIYYKILL